MHPAAHTSALEFRARYAETDQMGVVYHANYLVWCEMGRTDLIRHLWKPYSVIEKEGVMLAVTDVSMRYHASARYEDLIRVTTAVEQVRSRAISFTYLIERVEEDGSTTRLCSARTGLTALDRATSAPRKLPQDLLDAFRAATENIA